jgi:hypothetical protein
VHNRDSLVRFGVFIVIAEHANRCNRQVTAIAVKTMISATMSLIGSLPGTVSPTPLGRMNSAPSFRLYRFRTLL